MDEKELNNELNLLDTANERFKKVLKKSNNLNHEKFKKLGTSINNTSFLFEKEINNSKKRSHKYSAYKYGSIIMVNFGTNIGDEICGNHFAIVLTNNDNPYNSVLTVLPLSSKNKPNRVSLGELVSNKVNDDLCEKIEKLHEDKKIIYLKRVHDNSNIINCLNGYGQQLTIESSDTEIETSIKSVLSCYSSDTTSKLQELIHIKNNHEAEYNQLLKNSDKILDLIKYYTSKNRITYAIIDQIHSISKYKVLKPLNELDPISKLLVDAKTMLYIEHSIINKLFSKAQKIIDNKKKEC